MAFYNILNVFTVTFDQFNVQNICQKNLIDPKTLNIIVLLQWDMILVIQPTAYSNCIICLNVSVL